MRTFKFLTLLSLSVASPSVFSQAAEKIELYGLELGSQKSVYHQLGISQSSFYLTDGNFNEQQLKGEENERQADKIACKQSGFGIKKALSEAYHQLSANDEYLSARKESLNQRILKDLENTEVALISQTSKKYAQPVCHWAFNSVEYADKPEPTLVRKFKSKSGIEKLTRLSMHFNHQGQILSVSAEQIVERLDVDKLDKILRAIATRYEVELAAVSGMEKAQQQQVLEGKQAIKFNTKGKFCEFSAKNTYYRSEAAARTFGVKEAHAYIQLKCTQSSGLSYHEKKLNEYVAEAANKVMQELLAKHKGQMKSEGQKQENAGFVF